MSRQDLSKEFIEALPTIIFHLFLKNAENLRINHNRKLITAPKNNERLLITYHGYVHDSFPSLRNVICGAQLLLRLWLLSQPTREPEYSYYSLPNARLGEFKQMIEMNRPPLLFSLESSSRNSKVIVLNRNPCNIANPLN